MMTGSGPPSKVLVALVLWCVSSCDEAVWYPKSLPCDVTANRSTVVVDCTERGLKKIPPGIPGNATNITLTINHIPEIKTGSFQGLYGLVEIDLRCNCVPIKIGPKDRVCSKSVTIEDRSFWHLRNLKSLYLDGNQLSSIPRGLPPSLTLLSLEVNSIHTILRENLSELTNIEVLYFGQNCYYRNPCNVSYYIEEGAFSDLRNLTVLSLKSNNMSHVPHDLPASLKELYLYNNNIRSITAEDFRNLTELEILDLSGNCPRCYNAPFPCTPCPGNGELFVDAAAFKNLTKLKTLRLHSNSLTTVKSEWFQAKEGLQVLDLSSNFLARHITNTTFPVYLPGLEELDLSFNYELQRYPASLSLSPSFSYLTSLRVLRIRGFVFQQLTKKDISPLIQLRYLEILDLGTNFIKMTNLRILTELKNIKIINLSDNKISSPSDGERPKESFGGETSVATPMVGAAQYSGGEDVHYFRYDEYARSCKYKNKEASSAMPVIKQQCIEFGKTLDLSRNNIFFLDPKFLNFSELRCLNLSGNAMSQSLNGSEFKFLKNLQYLDFSYNRLDLLYSTAFQELSNLTVLDISQNEHYFVSEGLTHMLNFTNNLPKLDKLFMNFNQISTSTNTEMESRSLSLLEFKGNRLDMLWRDGDTRYVNYFRKLVNLTVLDISSNNLNFIPSQAIKGFPTNLRELYLSKNVFKTFSWGDLMYLSELEILDLSENKLQTVPRELANCTRSIKKLVLHNNQISKLTPHFLRDAYGLKHLDLSFNEIQYIQQSSFPEDVLNHLDMLLLHGNKFVCSCKAVWFVMWINRTTVNIPRLATEVTCADPSDLRGSSVIYLSVEACQHSSLSIILYVFLTSTILGVLTLSISAHLYLWDVWYIYHFCLAKVKGYSRLSSQTTAYDAFIVYDKKDRAVSDWVMEELQVQLEERGDPPLQLCLEERDWLPGCPTIDNLCQSIQQSKKTVFVLTNKYIRSGNFRMAFYLAHQRLMDEKADVILLIFLEKVPQRSKYLRLRKRLYRRSLLEWPSNPKAQPYFWHCLRSAMVTDGHKQYSKLFQEIL
ncbi:toll-like receptor 7 [Anguilla rostrata]|uniref:toll-like receptor 7 n=1 Tax=Anguilla rostrata TaxID=7938 RepID=UPI0030D4CA19